MCRLGLTALMISVTKGRAETVEFLLQSKAKVDQRADNGYSAVRRALFPDRPARDAK
jgi:ankyrin repeat protein